MKRIVYSLSIIIIIGTLNQKLLSAPNPNPHPIGVEVGFFFSSLSPHGEWIELEAGFRVWRPLHMHHQWRPYLLGRWVWTDDYGWYWMSNEPFGWVTYHYGRWYNDEYYGWVWIPDDVWGPAWVEWRYDNDYIGWAPLPPYAAFHMSFGIRFTTRWEAPYHYWNFVRYHRFGSIIRYRDVAPEEYSRRLIRTSRSVQQYGVDHDRIINRGVDRTMIERRGNLRISKTEVREVREQSRERMVRSGVNNRTQRIEMYRPSKDEIQRGAERVEARRGDHTLSIDMNKIERTRTERTTERPQREQQKISEPQKDRTLQRTPQPQEQQQREVQRQENKPRVQEQKPAQNRKEMRRELIQRYERKQNPSPPDLNKTSQQRIDEQKSTSPRTRTKGSASERSSHRSSTRARNR
jgi:hypothetical protein